MKTSNSDKSLMTTGEHLEVIRKMLFRILFVVLGLSVAIFILKEPVFEILMAPRNSNFIFYRGVEKFLSLFGIDYQFSAFSIKMISTDLSAQFMLHISTSLYLALLLASPYIVIELFFYIAPALYENELKQAIPIAIIVYLLFIVGVLMTYFILFPFSFRFLGTYQVYSDVENNITLSSYITTFISLSLVMGLVFQLPVLAYILAKLGVISSDLLREYRKWAIMLIASLSAIITPPDIFTLVMVALPLYMLYEISIIIIYKVEKGI